MPNSGTSNSNTSAVFPAFDTVIYSFHVVRIYVCRMDDAPHRQI